jgi:hypothetical protein
MHINRYGTPIRDLRYVPTAPVMHHPIAVQQDQFPLQQQTLHGTTKVGETRTVMASLKTRPKSRMGVDAKGRPG